MIDRYQTAQADASGPVGPRPKWRYHVGYEGPDKCSAVLIEIQDDRGHV
jgi:hypothetical protein